jgi:hypothetical protein
MPYFRERDLWWAFLSGQPESRWNPPKATKSKSKKQNMSAIPTVRTVDAVPTEIGPASVSDLPPDGDLPVAILKPPYLTPTLLKQIDPVSLVCLFVLHPH